MKYIRTKDGKIFDTEYEPKAFKWGWNAKFIIDDNNLIVYDTVFKDRIANHGQILKQSDTIEELCDWFCLVNKADKTDWCNTDLFPIKQELEILKEYDLYGTIITDKGHIYVARMKGILPNGEIDWELCYDI